MQGDGDGTRAMKRYLKILLPVLVLGGAALGARAILGSRPEPATRPERTTLQGVDAMRLAATDYPVIIRSRGTVRPTLASTLISEVTGAIVELSDDFVLGGAFVEGERLVQIERRDYEIALTRARASLAQAVAQLEEQSALAEQAALEWRQLGRRGEPSALTLRVPQLDAARADRDAAAAELERAELDLVRTTIVAPYDGRVLERAVDPGQFVNRGGVLGRIHSIAAVEVSLPLGARSQTWLALPDGEREPTVELEARVGGGIARWTGRLVRVEGVDADTRQLNVVARVDDPWADAAAPLRIGQYVEASLAGQVLEDVFVIPRSALREGREVLVLDEEERVHRREVVVAWSDENVAAIVEGLAEDELLVLTPLATVVDGTPVRSSVDGEPAAPLEPEPGEPDGRLGGDAAAGEEGASGDG